jgi:hypothetical protein
VHDTPDRLLYTGDGTAWSAQAVPFHRPANGTSVSEELRPFPTAVQALDDAHDTLASPPPNHGLGVD